MYIKGKKDFLKKHQKGRKFNIFKKNKHVLDSSKFLKKKNIFFKKFFLSIDLRFYKFLLIKCKKKFKKFKIKSYFFIKINKMISYKSKNSRMGKGKGMNYRYCFKLTHFKPIIVFKNMSKLRLKYFKKYFKKYFFFF